jgi:hypothetical protein
MISEPGVAPLLRIVSRDLRALVEPALSDRGVAITVQMMSAILDALAVRSESEALWMLEESDAILESAEGIATQHPEANELSERLKVARAATGSVVERYERASDILSCAAELALRSGDSVADSEVRRLLQRRLDHEIAMIGNNFQPIGRS